MYSLSRSCGFHLCSESRISVPLCPVNPEVYTMVSDPSGLAQITQQRLHYGVQSCRQVERQRPRNVLRTEPEFGVSNTVKIVLEAHSPVYTQSHLSGLNTHNHPRLEIGPGSCGIYIEYIAQMKPIRYLEQRFKHMTLFCHQALQQHTLLCMYSVSILHRLRCG